MVRIGPAADVALAVGHTGVLRKIALFVMTARSVVPMSRLVADPFGVVEGVGRVATGVAYAVAHTDVCAEIGLFITVLAISITPMVVLVVVVFVLEGVNMIFANVTYIVLLKARVSLGSNYDVGAAGKCVPMSVVIIRPLCRRSVLVVVVSAILADLGAFIV